MLASLAAEWTTEKQPHSAHLGSSWVQGGGGAVGPEWGRGKCQPHPDPATEAT